MDFLDRVWPAVKIDYQSSFWSAVEMYCHDSLRCMLRILGAERVTIRVGNVFSRILRVSVSLLCSEEVWVRGGDLGS